MIRATVITDASFCPKTKSAGWAAWVIVSATEHRVKRYDVFKKKPGNSTEAEKWALMNGLHIAIKLGCNNILLQTDCMSAVSYFASRDNLLKYYPKLDPLIKIRTRHVKGHTLLNDKRSYVNRWCDKHARIALNLSRQSLR